MSFPLKSDIGSKRDIERFIKRPELKAFIRQMVKDCLSHLGNIRSLSNAQIKQKCRDFLKDKHIKEAVKNELYTLEKIKNRKK